ncbi:MAG: hypothetical protein DHS20C19_27160 [Acidimicrobiales bacterium]|nr:MAG: hypothetical protein DHS20C19_27160 [Acidimicrobiales bacterium]
MRPVILVVAGVAIGLLAAIVLVTFVWDDDGDDAADSDPPLELSFPPVEHDVDAAEDLIIAWNRWRTATFVTSGTWTRTLDDGSDPLTGDVFIAQEPPRRLVFRLGSVTESIDGTVTTCDTSTDQAISPGCLASSSTRTYDERVADEMQLVLGFVVGDARLYDVGRDGECFRVELRETVLRSAWGRAAVFCFDEATGALASSRVRRQTATDVEITTAFRTEVTDEDFLS